MKSTIQRAELMLLIGVVTIGTVACTPAEVIKKKFAESTVPVTTEKIKASEHAKETEPVVTEKAALSDSDSVKKDDKEKFEQTNFKAPSADELLQIDVGENTECGEWGSYNLSEHSTGKIYTACMRISAVVKYSENPIYIDAKIAKYNNSGSIVQLNKAEDLQNNMEYILLEVDFYIPPNQKISHHCGVPLPFSISVGSDNSLRDEDGKPYKFDTAEFKKKDYSYSAGDKSHSQIIFPMLKGTTATYYLEARYVSDEDNRKYDKMKFYIN